MFNTYSGSMRLYLQAVRGSGEVIITFLNNKKKHSKFKIIQVVVKTKMLGGDGEGGLGAQENQPPVMIEAEVRPRLVKQTSSNSQVTCDSIALTVDGRVYNLDYDFGRHGVRDLGNFSLIPFLTTLNQNLFRGCWQPGEYRNGATDKFQQSWKASPELHH